MSLTPEQIDPMLVAADTEFRKLLEKLEQKRAYLVAWQKHATDCLGRHRRGDRLPTSVFEEIKRLIEQELAASGGAGDTATTPGFGAPAPAPAPTPTFGFGTTPAFGAAPSTTPGFGVPPASAVFAPPASTTSPFGFGSSTPSTSNPFSSSSMFGSSSSSSSNPFAHFGK